MNSTRSIARASRLAGWTRLLWVALLAVLWGGTGILPAHAVDFELTGRTQRPAWTGWWYPMLVSVPGPKLYGTGSFAPLLKYARWTGDEGPFEWERKYGMTTDPSGDWWGHCHAWAAAALREPKPIFNVWTGSVMFSRGETEGLLTKIWNAPRVSFFYGARHDQGANSTNDLRADKFHVAVLHSIIKRGDGLVFNLDWERGQVWSYPAFEARMKGVTNPADLSITHVTTTLLFADAGYPGSFDASFPLTFTYDLRGDPTSTTGTLTGWWTGRSVRQHPPFVWSPGAPGTYYPEWQAPNSLSIEKVQMLGKAAAGDQGQQSGRGDRQ